MEMYHKNNAFYDSIMNSGTMTPEVQNCKETVIPIL